MTISEFRTFFTKLKWKGRDAIIARDIHPEIEQRLQFLEHVGLDYLTLDRAAPTLSGGESQRIRLAAQLGSNLQGVLYVLDEPTIGLHPRDNTELIATLRKLQQRGNSLVIVEHDEDMMRESDHIIDLGPGAGINGGRIVAEGTWKEISKHHRSVTGLLLGKPLQHPIKGQRRPCDKTVPCLRVNGAKANNLKNVDVSIPLRRLTVLSGVSGSGKSTLMREVIQPAVLDALKKVPLAKGQRLWSKVEGFQQITQVTEVDQSPIGKTSRSTVATYLGIMDRLRELFASANLAKARGYTANYFSYNSGPGRCQSCQGQGTIKIDMNFLPSTYTVCDKCQGKRWSDPVLEVLFKDKSIHDVMQLSIDEAVGFFENQNSIQLPLKLMQETGLGYLTIGQTSPTLSGGEAQRLKLVTELAGSQLSINRNKMRSLQKVASSTLYLLEEPTVGLHLADVQKLIELLHRLVDEGHTVVVIEHHLDVIAEADNVIDIGPEAGLRGGTIVCEGTPEQVAQNSKSHTGRYLQPFLKKAKG
jgi:excinuclease ABC subunit A